MTARPDRRAAHRRGEAGDAAAEDEEVGRVLGHEEVGLAEGAPSYGATSRIECIVGWLSSSTCTTTGSYAGELRLVVLRVGDHDHLVAGVHEPRRRAVEDHVARAAADHVGLEAGAVVDVEHVHLLVLADVGELHQARVEGDRPDVVEIGAGDGRAGGSSTSS